MSEKETSAFEPEIPNVPIRWEVAPFQQVVSVASDAGKRIKQRDYLPFGVIPIIDQGQDYIGGYTNDTRMAFEGDLPVILFGDHTRAIKFVDKRFAVGAEGIKVLAPANCLQPKFFYYLLKSLEIPSRGYSRHFQFLRKFSLPIPPLAQQVRIVAEIEKQFSRLDEAVANLKRVKANLKRCKAVVLKAAVEGKLTEEWRKQHPDVEPAGKLLERILTDRRKAAGKGKGKYKEPVGPDTSGLPELPEGWVVASLEQITSAERVICYGILMPKENIPDGIPYVKVKDMKGDKIDIFGLHRTTPEIAAEYKRASLKAGDILLSIRGTYGRVAEVPTELEGGNITQDTARLVVMPPIVRDFVSWQLRATDMQSYFKRVARGVAVKGVNIGDVRPAPFFLPPIAEQHQIATEVERRLSIIAEAEAQVDANFRRADRLRQSILKQAFSGQLVPQDPNDEPASVLLERIRSNANLGALLAAPGNRTERPRRAQQAAPLQNTESKTVASGFTSLDSVLDAILNLMQPGEEYSRAEIADALGLSTSRWNVAIQELKRRGKVRQVGERRGARYMLKGKVLS